MSNSKAEIQEISAPTYNVSSNNVKYQPQELRLEAKEVTNIETFDQLPEDYDPRLTAILSEAVPDNVIVSYYYIAASKNPRNNYRWELNQDGRLFAVQHSGQNPSFEITFDQPLPSQPTKILSKDEIQTLYSQLEQGKFFDQPQLQRISVEGGNYVILRVRQGDRFHEVVYENVENPLLEYLYSITD
ncbi:hypothetical protein [Coleofasciculus sp.]|uniref:hypothetical protein n=1 Tax=Coleofasciculus sp. TaxID=3100458 RepID=UPI0039F8EE53